MDPASVAAAQDSLSTRLLILAAISGVIAALAAFASSWLSSRAADYYRRAGELGIAQAHKTATLASQGASEANLQVAQANERAARLQLEAEQLKDRLRTAEHVVSGRRLEASSRERLINTLRGTAPFKIAVSGPDMDPEAQTLAFDLLRAFMEAGGTSPAEYGLPACSSAGGPNQVTLYAPTLVDRDPIPLIKPEPAAQDHVYAALQNAGFNIAVCATVLHGVDQITPDYYALRVEHRGPTYLSK